MYTLCLINGYNYHYFNGKLLSISKENWTLTILNIGCRKWGWKKNREIKLVKEKQLYKHLLKNTIDYSNIVLKTERNM